MILPYNIDSVATEGGGPHPAEASMVGRPVRCGTPDLFLGPRTGLRHESVRVKPFLNVTVASVVEPFEM